MYLETWIMSIEIKCINKSARMNPHERILAVGGINPNGSRWRLSQVEAIAGIESGQYAFHVQQGDAMCG